MEKRGVESSRKNSVKSVFEQNGVVLWRRRGGGRESELGVASSLGALSVYFLLCTDQECRGEAGLGSRGKEQSVGLLLRHLDGGSRHSNSQNFNRGGSHGHHLNAAAPRLRLTHEKA